MKSIKSEDVIGIFFNLGCGGRSGHLVTGLEKAFGGILADVTVLMRLEVFGVELGNYSSANPGSYLKMVQTTQVHKASSGFYRAYSTLSGIIATTSLDFIHGSSYKGSYLWWLRS